MKWGNGCCGGGLRVGVPTGAGGDWSRKQMCCLPPPLLRGRSHSLSAYISPGGHWGIPSFLLPLTPLSPPPPLPSRPIHALGTTIAGEGPLPLNLLGGRSGIVMSCTGHIHGPANGGRAGNCHRKSFHLVGEEWGGREVGGRDGSGMGQWGVLVPGGVEPRGSHWPSLIPPRPSGSHKLRLALVGCPRLSPLLTGPSSTLARPTSQIRRADFGGN